MSNEIDMQFQEVGNELSDIRHAMSGLEHELDELYEAFRIMRGHAYKELERRICDLEQDVEKLRAGKPVNGAGDNKAVAACVRGKVARN